MYTLCHIYSVHKHTCEEQSVSEKNRKSGRRRRRRKQNQPEKSEFNAVIHIIPRRKENYALVSQFKGKSTFSTSKELICGIITID